MFKVSKTYDVVTPESAEYGDFADSGFIYESTDMSLRDLLEEINSLGYYEHNSNAFDNANHISLYGVDSEIDYSDASETREALHIEASPRALKRLGRILKRVKQ